MNLATLPVPSLRFFPAWSGSTVWITSRSTCRRSAVRGTGGGNPEGLILEGLWNCASAAKNLAFRGCLPPPLDAVSQQLVRSLILENTTAEFTAILSSVPCVQFLDVSCGSRAPLLAPIPLKTSSLHSLVELCVHELPTGHCAKLLDSLHTPNLTHLTVGNFGAPELRSLWEAREDMKWYDLMDVYGSALAAFAERTPSLEVVRLLRSPIDDRHFVRLLPHLPNLRELFLDTLLVGLPAMRGLTPSSPGKGKEKAVICPRLQRLCIRSCESIQKQHLINLIQARNDAKAQCLPILQAEVVECKEFGIEDEAPLSNLDPGRLQVIII